MLLFGSSFRDLNGLPAMMADKGPRLSGNGEEL